MKNAFFLYLSIVLCGLFGIVCAVRPSEVKVQFILVFCLFILLSLYSFFNREKTISLLLFLISFFTFLLGGYFVSMLFLEDRMSMLSKTTNIVLFTALLGIFLGNYLFLNRFSLQYKKNINASFYIQLRKVSLVIFYISVSFKLLQSLEGLYLLRTYSYANLDAVSRLPQFVVRFSLICYLSFWAYLCTYPSKQELKKPFRLFMVALCSSIFMGERGELVYGLFTLLFYFISRDYMALKNGRNMERFITRKQWIMIGVSIPCLLVFFNLYAFVRSSQEVESEGFLMDIVGFFVQQGFSLNLINYAQEYRYSLPDTNTSYVFGVVQDYISTFWGEQNMHHLSELSYTALYGNNLGATLTYLADPVYYYSGGGFGTQYLAELYIDFGMLGVFVYNVFLGCFLRFLSMDVSRTYFFRVYCLIIIIGLFSMPRDFCFAWVIRLISPLNFFVIVSIYGMSLYLLKKEAVNTHI